MQVAEKNDKLNLPSFGAPVQNFLDWREQAQSFSDLGAVGYNNITGSGEPEQLSGNHISLALIRVLGVRPDAGRSFTDDEEKPSSAPVAMIGEGCGSAVSDTICRSLAARSCSTALPQWWSALSRPGLT